MENIEQFKKLRDIFIKLASAMDTYIELEDKASKGENVTKEECANILNDYVVLLSELQMLSK